MNHGITIKHFLVTGDPSGIISAEMSNWTGQAIKIPGNLLKDAKNRPEVLKPGIYFLFGVSQNPQTPDQKRVYIGESEEVFRRISYHLGTKKLEDFYCDDIVAFSSKDDNLTKAHIRYLEFKLIKMAMKSADYDIHNTQNITNEKEPPLPESAKAEMDTYLDNLQIILPTLGFNLLKKAGNIPRDKQRDFHLDCAGIKASGRISNSGFTVFKGSRAKGEHTTSLGKSYLRLREKLKSTGLLDEREDQLVFKSNYEFSSPSAAAAVIFGYNANGLTAWKNAEGKSLKDAESEELKTGI
ncbi:MAG: GIY-YIG nuclease family protein [bacterium]|nr:GIY-YIG nuclease family protein [bacterium]